MDIVVRSRHTEVPDRFRKHVADKLGKVEKLDHKVIRIDVEVSKERNPRLSDHSDRVQLTCVSRGPVIRAEAAADDPYGALDLACAKLEARLRKVADRRRVHHGSRTPISVAAATEHTADALLNGSEPAGSGEGAAAGSGGTARAVEDGDRIVPMDVEGDGPLVVREKVHAAEPMSLDQALFEMELVGHDFYLFVDGDSRRPSVVYRRRGYDYGVIRLES
ncbi:MAG: ribosome hibernation-promoting factor, HPF/YfiA family [Actinomycetes bacterium]